MHGHFPCRKGLLSGSLHPPLVQPVPRMTAFQRPPYIVRQYLQKPTQRGAPGLSPWRTPPSFRGADRRGAGQVGRWAAPRAIPPICRLSGGGNPSQMNRCAPNPTCAGVCTCMYPSVAPESASRGVLVQATLAVHEATRAPPERADRWAESSRRAQHRHRHPRIALATRRCGSQADRSHPSATNVQWPTALVCFATARSLDAG